MLLVLIDRKSAGDYDWRLEILKVYLLWDIQCFVMYYICVMSRPSLLIESTDSMISLLLFYGSSLEEIPREILCRILQSMSHLVQQCDPPDMQGNLDDVYYCWGIDPSPKNGPQIFVVSFFVLISADGPSNHHTKQFEVFLISDCWFYKI